MRECGSGLGGGGAAKQIERGRAIGADRTYLREAGKQTAAALRPRLRSGGALLAGHLHDLRREVRGALDIGWREAAGDGAAFCVGAVVEVGIASAGNLVVNGGSGGATLAGGDGLRKGRLDDVVGALEGGGARQEGLAARAIVGVVVGGVARTLRGGFLWNPGGRFEGHGGIGEVLAEPFGNQRAAAARHAPATLDETVEVVALESDAVAEQGETAEEECQSGERCGTCDADEVEGGCRQLVDPIADDAAEAVPERPSGRERQRREASGKQQHGERKEAGLLAVGADALGEHELQPPEHRGKEQEHAGKTESVEQHVGEDGATRAERVGGCAVGGVRKAGVGLRPGEKASPSGGYACQEGEPPGADRPSNQPFFHSRRKQASRVMRPERHLERTLLRKYYY